MCVYVYVAVDSSHHAGSLYGIIIKANIRIRSVYMRVYTHTNIYI